jgi:hypothetical protein
MRPSFESAKPLRLVEVPPHPRTARGLINPLNSYLREYRLGECSVIVTKELGRWHLSIAHPERYPTWDEIAEARYRILPESITVAMLLPPRSEYVNLHNHCFQMHEIDKPAHVI